MGSRLVVGCGDDGSSEETGTGIGSGVNDLSMPSF